MQDELDNLVHRAISGDQVAAALVRRRAATATAPNLLVVAALLAVDPVPLLSRAAQHATTTRDRQLVALAAAHVDHDHERCDALVRDHLADYPDNVIAAWIAASHRPPHHSPRPEGAHR